MMSLASIEYESRKAARRAAREHKHPFVMFQSDIDLAQAGSMEALRNIPFIGNYTPRGFKKTENLYFVDSSGFGGDNEPALSINQFLRKLRVNYAYAIVEAGQFQVYIQEYSVKV